MNSKNRQNEDEQEAKRLFNLASHDTTEILLPMDVSQCTEVLLIFLDGVANGKIEDDALPAALELIALFGTPVLEMHAQLEPFIQRILYNSRHIVMWSERGPGE